MVGKYKVITLCGSTRFKNEFMDTQKKLTLEGNIVISVGLFGHSGDNEVWESMDEGTLTKTKEMLDDMHKRKIDMADEIFVINVGGYKIQSGEMIRVCMTSDFFLEQADEWRQDAWNVIRERSDVKFFLLTKRPQRVSGCLPPDWGDGWENVFFNVTCENQRRADERIPILHTLSPHSSV